MKAIMIMFDSLNRHMLPAYGCDWVHMPNFKRLQEKTVTFDQAYVGSLPCMPARRELHTGRYNFLHRSWGPLEPFDDSMPELLKNQGVYTHIVSDHYHYWEDGGATYHKRYSSWEMVRGQEMDTWKGEVKDPDLSGYLALDRDQALRTNIINRQYMIKEEDHHLAQTFNLGLAFIEKNKDEDNWFLHIEAFDPHEPYFTPQDYKRAYQKQSRDTVFDWPPYRKVEETQEQVESCKQEAAALFSMCDAYLGKVLDLMDKEDLWKDTMLIVNTDHGFLMGEHGWWAKGNGVPLYNEIAHIPLFIWDPRSKVCDQRRQALVQTIDLAPTLLEFFNVSIPMHMEGKSLRHTIINDSPIRKVALYGKFGEHVNCTDGRYVYMRGSKNPSNKPLNQYTLMPTGHGSDRAFMRLRELKTMEIAKPFGFTKGCPVMKIKCWGGMYDKQHETMLFDLLNDPDQQHPIKDQEVECMMIQAMIEVMKQNEAPEDQFKRLGLQ